jgi:soluble lytic murein transglycosylase-like protein
MNIKKIVPLILTLSISVNAHSNSVLDNSVWGVAASYAGINVATLYGIAVQESGMRWRDGSFRPWPWTLNINKSKKGIKAGPRRYANKEAAEQALKALIEEGIRNVDVGIMQVNLYWHGNKVSNELDLLDPKTNISVAASYLKALRAQNDIRKTVADYHAPTNAVRGNSYANHVERFEKIINEKLK